MKTLRLICAASVLSIGFYSIGCETSHQEKDSTNILGQHTHEDTTTTHNPVTGTNDTSTTVQKN